MSKTDNRRPNRDSKTQREQPAAPDPAARERKHQRAPATLPDTPAAPVSSSAPPGRLVRIGRWFLSRQVRQATAMRKHVRKLLNHQRDILSPQAVDAIASADRDLVGALYARADKPTVDKQMEKVENAANKWLKPYPNAAWRENIEVLLVALTVAMGIRTFFLQPFKIPTGSMQPTLYGVTSENLLDQPNYQFPKGWDAVRDWFAGVSYIHKVAESDGTLDAVDPPFGLRIFNLWQTFVVGGKSYTIWFPPDYGSLTLQDRAGLHLRQEFHRGEDIIKLKVRAGDHLFVDRVSYNFRTPQRGEIVVFETRGIQGLPQDQFYIKRLVGLGGETLSLNKDHEVTGVPGMGTAAVGNLLVNGQPVTASTPHFENLYSFGGASPRMDVLPYKENRYFGHAMIGKLQPGLEFPVETNHCFVMGDNTMNSLDSRYWGDFPQGQVIGKSFFVYWPITERFGIGYKR